MPPSAAALSSSGTFAVAAGRSAPASPASSMSLAPHAVRNTCASPSATRPWPASDGWPIGMLGWSSANTATDVTFAAVAAEAAAAAVAAVAAEAAATSTVLLGALARVASALLVAASEPPYAAAL
eukprot:3146677-Prymnesium_polylepis.1